MLTKKTLFAGFAGNFQTTRVAQTIGFANVGGKNPMTFHTTGLKLLLIEQPTLFARLIGSWCVNIRLFWRRSFKPALWPSGVWWMSRTLRT